MLDVLFPAISALLVVVILPLISRRKGKVDKGFKFNYFRLSYRRKLIRTFINLPLIVLLFFAMFYWTDWGIGTMIPLELLLFAVFMVQLAYNYHMWKRHES